ncbi:MAG TPA: hypothetical protein DIW32_06420 [Eubacterium sp.]|nr:hypothetical protein [Eubacterium sp.]
MLGWLCIVQSLLAYTPGIRAGAILLGLPPLVPAGGFAPATPFNMLKRFIGIYCCAIKCTNFVFIAL